MWMYDLSRIENNNIGKYLIEWDCWRTAYASCVWNSTNTILITINVPNCPYLNDRRFERPFHGDINIGQSAMSSQRHTFRVQIPVHSHFTSHKYYLCIFFLLLVGASCQRQNSVNEELFYYVLFETHFFVCVCDIMFCFCFGQNVAIPNHRENI